MDTAIADVIVEIRKVEQDIENADLNIRRVEEEIENAERRYGEQVTDHNRSYLHEQLQHLWKKEDSLRRDKDNLQRKEQQLRDERKQLQDERKLQLQLKRNEEILLQEEPNPRALRSKKPKRSQEDPQPVDFVAEERYFETLLEPPADLPRTPTELKKFLSQVPVKLPIADRRIFQTIKNPKLLTEEFGGEAANLPGLVSSALSAMENQGRLNEPTSSANLYQVTGQFIKFLNELAPLSRRLDNVLVMLDSSNPKSYQTASQPLELLARPDLQLFVNGCLILRWENKVDLKSFRVAERENCDKLRTWSPFFYGGLPYVVGGCCAGSQFQWLMLRPSAKGIKADAISRIYDLNSLKRVTEFLHSNVRMHCLLQKLQEFLGEPIEFPLYTPQERPNNVTITFYPDCVKKEIPGVDEGSFRMIERLYAAVNHSKYLIHGRVRRLRKNTILTLEPVGDSCSTPTSLDELESAAHDILCGLKDLHKAEYTHRDVRWENCIKVNVKGVWKWILIDLEAAGEAGEEVDPSCSLRIWDENTLQGKNKYTKASDRYLLGKLLLEWLNGNNPVDKKLCQLMKSKAEELMITDSPDKQVENLFCKRSCKRCKFFTNDS